MCPAFVEKRYMEDPAAMSAADPTESYAPEGTLRNLTLRALVLPATPAGCYEMLRPNPVIGSETERALEPCARAVFRLHLSTRIYALNWYRTDNVQPVACDLLAERRICDLVDARAEEAYAPPNQAAICWQAGKQEQGSQN